jgi:hypothetical protein
MSSGWHKFRAKWADVVEQAFGDDCGIIFRRGLTYCTKTGSKVVILGGGWYIEYGYSFDKSDMIFKKSV